MLHFLIIGLQWKLCGICLQNSHIASGVEAFCDIFAVADVSFLFALLLLLH